MKPDGVNGAASAQKPTLLERIDKVDVSNTNKLSQELAGITDEVNAKIANAFSADGDGGEKVTKSESASLNILRTYLCNLNSRLKSSLQNANDQIKNVYEQLVKNTTELIERTTNAENGKNPDALASCEPEETDAQNKNQYAYLDKKADNLLEKSLKEDRERIASSKQFALNPTCYDRKPQPSGETIDKIKDLYMSTTSVNGKRYRGFLEEAKINSLIAWAEKKRAIGAIDIHEYNDLTKDAKMALMEIKSKEKLAVIQQSEKEDEPDNNQASQINYPAYDSKNDGHQAAWEVAGIKEEDI